MAINASIAGVLCMIGVFLAPAAFPADSSVHVSVRTDQSGPVINPAIFGQFAEHLGSGIYGGVWVGRNSPIPNVRGIRADVVAALKELKVPVVRWPGGCFGDEYHWRKGIGPADSRAVTLNSNWGGVTEPNSFGTEEFMDFIGQIGAAAYVSVNVGSGSPEESADWLEYMTTSQPTTLGRERAANGHPAPYEVAYLGLGNENWGCGGAMSPDHYVEEMKRFSHYTRNLNPAQTAERAMQRIAVGWDGQNSDYTEAILKAWKDRVWSWDIEGISLHSYTVGGWPPHLPSTGFGNDDYALMIHETFGMESLIARESALMDRYDPKKKLALVVDEWGAWLAPSAGSNPGFLQQHNSLRDAILAAVNLNIFMRHADRVRMSNIAQMVNVLQAMIVTDGPKMALTPTYQVYRMYVPFQGATLLPVAADGGTFDQNGTRLPRLDAIVARDRAGQLWASLTNLDPEHPLEVTIDLPRLRVRSASGTLLTAARVDAVNTIEDPTQVSPRALTVRPGEGALHLTLPPKSITVLSMQADRQ